VVVTGAVTGGSYTQEFAISYLGNYNDNSTINGHDIVLTAIPEPATWTLLLGGCSGCRAPAAQTLNTEAQRP
jgi:hypothetical protein